MSDVKTLAELNKVNFSELIPITHLALSGTDHLPSSCFPARPHLMVTDSIPGRP